MSTTNINTGQVLVGAITECLVVPARTGRVSIILTSTSGIWIGPAGVTSATGFQVPTNASGQISVEMETEAEIHALATTFPATVSFIEQF